MSKARYFAELLQKGQTIEKYKEGGNSMTPIISHNQPVKLEPVTEDTVLNVGDIVFCKVKGNYFTHKITKKSEDKYLISNNKGRDNGWIRIKDIFGIVTKIY